MMERFAIFWQQRTQRERRLIGVMAVLAVTLFIWLAVVRPVQRALDDATGAHEEAVARYGDIVAKSALLKQDVSESSTAPAAAIDQLVGASAGEAGFTLDHVTPQGPNRIEIAMASARAPALFAWIGMLEQQHIRVETLHVTPAADGTVALRAVLVGGANGLGAQ
jgi:general secretion pathway protein M